MTAPALLSIAIRFERPGIPADLRRPVARAATDLLNACQRRLARAPRHRRYPGCEVSVLFCSEARIHRLNREFLGVDRPTDVLSFPADDPAHLGDLALCIPYAARQAPSFRRTPARECALLLVHGLLHLHGHDHDTPARERRMWALTDRLLALPEAIAFNSLALRADGD